MTPWVSEKLFALAERGHKCEECGKYTDALEFHHGLIHRNKRFAEWIDKRYNGALVCQECHQRGEVDTLDWRREFWVRQVNRYGYELMVDWIDSLPDKLRYRIDFVS